MTKRLNAPPAACVYVTDRTYGILVERKYIESTAEADNLYSVEITPLGKKLLGKFLIQEHRAKGWGGKRTNQTGRPRLGAKKRVHFGCLVEPQTKKVIGEYAVRHGRSIGSVLDSIAKQLDRLSDSGKSKSESNKKIAPAKM